MIKGVLSYNNRVYSFELQGRDVLGISFAKFSIEKSVYGKLNYLKDIIKINFEERNLFKETCNINDVYLLGISDESKIILFNVLSIESFKINMNFTMQSNSENIEFKIRYYFIMDEFLIYDELCNSNNINILMKIDGNDIRNFYTSNLNNNKCKILNSFSISEYEYIYNNKRFKINVDIIETIDCKRNENYYKTKIRNYNILGFKVDIKNMKHVGHILGLIHAIYYGCLNFFRYIYMKRYVDINDNSSIEFNIEDEKYDFTFVYCGDDFKLENEKKYKSNIIRYDDIQDYNFLGELFRLSIESELYLNHLPDTINERYT